MLHHRSIWDMKRSSAIADQPRRARTRCVGWNIAVRPCTNFIALEKASMTLKVTQITFHRLLWILASSLSFHIWRLCCHSNETRALIANPPNGEQLGRTPCYCPKLHLGQCSVGMRWWTAHTDCRRTHTQSDIHRRGRPIYISFCYV